ncbi:hypothetical protein ABZ904_18055 [Streptomyces sp. NPDC046900]|uniref:TRADD-N-associated membrane domain-containing protein n=1 Tax=Streptomyces sp. NPDC046900 TaxID=3155473 RepID=UPI0033DAD35F
MDSQWAATTFLVVVMSLVLLVRAVQPIVNKRIQADVDKERERLLAGLPANGIPVSERREAQEERFSNVLIEYYVFGLVLAKRSFSVSLVCSVIGGLVLICGVGIGIYKAETNGDLYIAAVTSSAGVVVSIIGALFHRRADLSLRHMQDQSKGLRLDMKAERDAGQAVRLLEDVEDTALKAHLQAALILKFSAAELPELDGVLKSADLLPQSHVNGSVPQQQSETSAS